MERVSTILCFLLQDTALFFGLRLFHIIKNKPDWSHSSDTPLTLGLAALQAIPELTGTKGTGFDFSIYTGDLVAHDADNQLSRSDLSSLHFEFVLMGRI
jgi:hypothetical protein